MRLDDAVPLAQLWIEERADAGLQQDRLVAVAHDHAPARERDPVVLVRLDPLLPHRARSVAEHRATVEALRVAEYRRQRSHRKSFTTDLTSGPRAHDAFEMALRVLRQSECRQLIAQPCERSTARDKSI